MSHVKTAAILTISGSVVAVAAYIVYELEQKKKADQAYSQLLLLSKGQPHTEAIATSVVVSGLNIPNPSPITNPPTAPPPMPDPNQFGCRVDPNSGNQGAGCGGSGKIPLMPMPSQTSLSEAQRNFMNGIVTVTPRRS